jgi:hypothetical protein
LITKRRKCVSARRTFGKKQGKRQVLKIKSGFQANERMNFGKRELIVSRNIFQEDA